MSFRSDNAAFEAWLRRRCKVVEKDLKYKHERMKESAFAFLRATFFRWAKRIETVCPDLATAPAVLSVGDVHLENFGTWRDAEGRIVWGINDFDEAAVIPYPFDLVRLVTSARLAPGLTVPSRVIAEMVLAGYRDGLEEPRPTLIDQHGLWMGDYVSGTSADRRAFWDDIKALNKKKAAAKPIPGAVKQGLRKSLPAHAEVRFFAPRKRGGGSLGRPRYIVSAVWQGGRVIREAKALVPSAWSWAKNEKRPQIHFLALSTGRYRSPDPFLAIRGKFVYRRIAPDARKVELDREAQAKLPERLLRAMGFDLGAIHAAAGKKTVAAILADLKARPADWLNEAAGAAAADVERDYAEWKR